MVDLNSAEESKNELEWKTSIPSAFENILTFYPLYIDWDVFFHSELCWNEILLKVNSIVIKVGREGRRERRREKERETERQREEKSH